MLILFVYSISSLHYIYSVSGTDSKHSWLPEARRLGRGNPKLVARHTLSSSTQAQALTALGLSGVRGGASTRSDQTEGGTEKKLPPQVRRSCESSVLVTCLTCCLWLTQGAVCIKNCPCQPPLCWVQHCSYKQNPCHFLHSKPSHTPCIWPSFHIFIYRNGDGHCRLPDR